MEEKLPHLDFIKLFLSYFTSNSNLIQPHQTINFNMLDIILLKCLVQRPYNIWFSVDISLNPGNGNYKKYNLFKQI